MTRRLLPIVGVAAIALVVVAESLPRNASARVAVACDPDNGGLTLPAGFCATVFADSLGAPRHLTVQPNGDVYVDVNPRRGGGESGSGIGPGGGVLYLKDTDGDGHADVKEKIGDGGGTDVAVANGFLYATSRNNVVRYAMADGKVNKTAIDTLIRDMPTGGHVAYNFVVDGKVLYLNIGSPSNSCQAKDRQNESRGVDPCVELDTRAGIWQFDALKPNQTAADGQRFVTGIRNAVGLAMNSTEHVLYTMQHGRDQLFQNWGKLFTVEQSAEWPAEEMFRLTKGDDFGWPYCFFNPELKLKVLAPEYGGDGKTPGRCAQKKSNVVYFPGHWAPNALLFYTGSQFPVGYKNGAFVAFHGSWNRAPLPQGGFNVTFVPFAGGKPSGPYQVFADGFSPEGKPSPSGLHRPTGLAQGPDGALYVSDDAGGRIWKISYKGK